MGTRWSTSTGRQTRQQQRASIFHNMNCNYFLTFLPVVFSLFTNSAAAATPDADRVTALPGFGDLTELGFKIYSGYLHVPGPFLLNGYGALEIHYQLQTSQSSADDPLVTWHQGGPGGSSITVGLYTEMGALQIDDNGPYLNEQYAWNKAAHMLYLESPAGSGKSSGYSACIDKQGNDVDCEWDDLSQAEAYAHTLMAFKKKFPEYASNDLYLTGESYFGQYGPNIANYIVSNNDRFSSLNLRGMALGNACWGGNETHVDCNGPNREQNDVDMLFGKGIISKKMYESVYEACDFPLVDHHVTKVCDKKLHEVSRAVGPHNPYNIYDTCSEMADFLKATGKSMRWYKKQLLDSMPGSFDHNKALYEHGVTIVGANNGTSSAMASRKLLRSIDDNDHAKDGGYVWSCGGIQATASWILQEDVKQALHLKEADRSKFSYIRSGPASITLYPYLIKRLRILIYNGDADAVVGYKGNEEWINALESTGAIVESHAWRPWYAEQGSRAPAGSVTSYTVTNHFTDIEIDFHFLTIRLAGHMVPTYQPGASSYFIQRFLASEPY